MLSLLKICVAQDFRRNPGLSGERDPEQDEDDEEHGAAAPGVHRLEEAALARLRRAAIARPQPGQYGADVDTRCPQSGQVVSVMVIPPVHPARSCGLSSAGPSSRNGRSSRWSTARARMSRVRTVTGLIPSWSAISAGVSPRSRPSTTSRCVCGIFADATRWTARANSRE
jgi:hypothetical protein